MVYKIKKNYKKEKEKTYLIYILNIILYKKYL